MIILNLWCRGQIIIRRPAKTVTRFTYQTIDRHRNTPTKIHYTSSAYILTQFTIISEVLILTYLYLYKK